MFYYVALDGLELIHYVEQDGLELIEICFLSPGIKDMQHHAWGNWSFPAMLYFKALLKAALPNVIIVGGYLCKNEYIKVVSFIQ